MHCSVLTLFLLITSLGVIQQDCSGPSARDESELLLENGILVDPRTQTLVKRTLLLREGRIAQVYATPPAAYHGPRLDVAGRYLLPALTDMHMHAVGNTGPGSAVDVMTVEQVMRRQLYCGVTRTLDLFNTEDTVFAIRNSQRTHPRPAADLYCAGPALTCPGGHGTQFDIPTRTINSPAEAAQVVTALAARHPDVVKVIYDHYGTWMPTIDKATLVAALHAAQQQHLKTVVHVGTWQDVRDAVQAGATAVTHVPPAAMPADIGPLLLSHKAYFIPALAVQMELAHIERDSSLLHDPLLHAVSSPALRRSYRPTPAHAPHIQRLIRWQQQHEAVVQQSMRSLSQQGVRLLAGTDAGNPGTFQGYSLHRELQLLAAAGLSNWSVLAAATTRAGDFFGEPVGFQPGSPANFLVLQQSPVADIRNTRSIEHIIQRGQVVDRQSLLNP